MVDLLHEGEESYYNMWQKTRSIWAYMYDNYLDEYDYFHLGGDDLYLIVENLRRFLERVEDQNEDQPRYFGQWVPQPISADYQYPIPKNHSYMVSGGPGYVINSAALKRFVENALPYCHVKDRVAYEDRLMSTCLRELGIIGGDTRDIIAGEQQYHDTSPANVYLSRATKKKHASFHSRISYYWQALPLPRQDASTRTVEDVASGPKHELEAAAPHSISFHDLYTPIYASRIHTIIHRETCPGTTPLGKAMQQI